jgi:hypothetical protein
MMKLLRSEQSCGEQQPPGLVSVGKRGLVKSAVRLRGASLASFDRE